MDWMMLSGNVPSLALISLGVLCEDQYYLDDNCLQYLEEILEKLANEDKSSRSFRRAFAFMNIAKKDLVPILMCVKDEPAIFHATVKVLVELTIPVECLIPVETVSVTSSGLHLLHELQYLLHNAKEGFLDPRATKALLDEISPLVQKDRWQLSDEECERVHNILMLLRNILHTPDKPLPSQPSATSQSQQNRLLWNLFAQGLDHCILQMLQSPYSDRWAVTVVQLIALFYKDQHVETLQRLLSNWMDNESDSSEDNESNTSPPAHGSSHSTPMVTSRPTSDSSSSDSGQQAQPAIVGPSSSLPASMRSEGSLEKESLSPSSGFGSEPSFEMTLQAKSEEERTKSHVSKARARPATEMTCTTTSSEDTHTRPKRTAKGCRAKAQALKPSIQHISTVPDKDKRRKKLYKRSRTYNQHSKITTKLTHTPTEEDIAEMLREFTVDLLLQGYDQLVGQIHDQLLKDPTLPMDKSHFLWLITYFLRFASQLELDLKHIGRVLSLELVSYLCLEGLLMSEQVELTYQQGCSAELLKPHLRRLHLAVTALREVFQALETYSRLTLSNEDREDLQNLRLGLADMVDLRQLFLLLIRHYNPVLQNRRYLRDVITTNHVLLVTLERTAQLPAFKGTFNITEHLKQFCTPSVVRQYGLALEDFQTNGPFVNDCILTVLHHVGGDLGQAELLCQPLVLRAFSAIWEAEFELCDDWVDLIEYTMQRFLRSVASSSSTALATARGNAADDWNQTMPLFGTSHPSLPNIPLRKEATEEDPAERLEKLKGQLIEAGYEWALQWVQKVLMETCAARLLALESREWAHPVASLTQKLGIGMPLVAWTEDQAEVLRFEPFALVLHHLGIVPALGGGIYPRIPYHWDPNTLYSLAKALGPLPEDSLLFSEALVEEITLPSLPLSPASEQPDSQLTPPYAGPGPSTSMSLLPHTWLHWVEASGSLVRSAERAVSSSSGPSQRGPKAMDSASTTSSLEVHKTESCDSSDGEMTDEEVDEELFSLLERDAKF